jgi:hypothetical protein
MVATTGKAQNRIIKLTGAITGNQTVTLPVLHGKLLHY